MMGEQLSSQSPELAYILRTLEDIRAGQKELVQARELEAVRKDIGHLISKIDGLICDQTSIHTQMTSLSVKVSILWAAAGALILMYISLIIKYLRWI